MRRPVVGFDYFFMKDEDGNDNKMLTLLAAREDLNKNVFCTIAARKGNVVPWINDSLSSFIDALGYKELALKTDNESSIKSLRLAVCDKVRADCIEEDATLGDKPANGLAESAVQSCEGMIRTQICHYEMKMNETMNLDCPLFPWMAIHAGVLLSRCLRGDDGLSAYQRLHGRIPPQEMVPL